jgi:hypothetical protein
MFEWSARAVRLAPLFALACVLGCGASPAPLVETTIAPRPTAPSIAPPAPADTATSTSADRFVVFPERGAARAPLALRCGAFVVHRDERDDGRVSVTDARGATVLLFAPSDALETVDAAWCGDVDGDDRPELAIFKTSGGAHCCRTDSLFTLADHPIERLRFEAGNAGGLRAEDVDGDGKLELVSADDALAEIGDVPYAFTLFLPVVFARDARGAWTRSTPRFKAYLAGERRAAQRDLDACNGDATCQLAWAEKIAGLSVLLGDWADSSTRLALPADLMRTTMAAAARLSKILRARGEPLP